MYKCKKCNFETENKSLIANHYKSVHTKFEKIKCELCGKEFNGLGAAARHIKNKSCQPKQKEQKIITTKCHICGKEIYNCNIKKHINKHLNQKIKSPRLNPGKGNTIESENIRRKKLSDAIKLRYKSGWMPKSGRCKKIKYNSKIAGIVLLDGTWELKVAQYFDDNNINWKRNTTRFKYIHLNGKESHYTPDFYLPDTNEYIEIKGYETDLDRCKWNQFHEKLIIWKQVDLRNKGIIG